MSPSSQSRNIRVFLSSCFQDMQSERNYLVEHTFQTFRHIAAQRHVDFSVVDLRWGVTEEDVQQGKVIEILAGLSAPEYSQGYDMNRFIQDFELTPDAELSNAVIAFLERRKVNATN